MSKNDNKFDRLATGVVFTVIGSLGIAWLVFMGWVIVTLLHWITSK